MHTALRHLPVFVLSLSTSALAQSQPRELPPEPTFIVPEVTELDMSGAHVTAGVVTPGISVVIEPARPGFPPMLPIRRSFTDEIAESVDTVR